MDRVEFDFKGDNLEGKRNWMRGEPCSVLVRQGGQCTLLEFLVLGKVFWKCSRLESRAMNPLRGWSSWILKGQARWFRAGHARCERGESTLIIRGWQIIRSILKKGWQLVKCWRMRKWQWACAMTEVWVLLDFHTQYAGSAGENFDDVLSCCRPLGDPTKSVQCKSGIDWNMQLIRANVSSTSAWGRK